MPNPRKKKPNKGFPDIDLEHELDEFFGDEEEVEAPRPGVPVDTTSDLWATYGVNPALPFRIKVEKLRTMWSLDVSEIADALGEDQGRIQDEVDRLESEWQVLGEALSEDDRSMERGILIKELMKIKSELEMAYAAKPDHRLLTAKLNVIDRIAKLRGVERDKNEKAEDNSSSSLEERMSQLSIESRRKLLEQLSKPKQP